MVQVYGREVLCRHDHGLQRHLLGQVLAGNGHKLQASRPCVPQEKTGQVGP